MWRETSLLCDRAVHIANSKTHVFADSVLCLRSLSDKPVEAWKDRTKWFLETRYLKDLDRNRRGADGVRVDNFPRIHYVGNSR